MSTVTVMTAAKTQELFDETVTGASIDGSGHLILSKAGGDNVDAGNVVGPTGATGSAGPTGPTGTPTGALIMYAGTLAPSGWLLCDGSAVSRSTYSNLFAAIGTLYGSGDGTTTFNVPDMTSRFPRMDPSSANVGNTGGATSHIHPITDHSHQIDGGSNQAVARIAAQTGAAANIYVQETTANSWNATVSGDITTSQTSSASKTVGAAVVGQTQNAGLTTTGANSPSTSPSIPPYLNVTFIIKI